MPSTRVVPSYDIPEVEKTIRFIGLSSEFKSEKLDAKIVGAIRDCPGLTSLDLQVYRICLKSAEVIGKALESQSNLKRVFWRLMFNFTDRKEIPQALSCLVKGIATANAHIVALNLSENSLDSGGMMGLKYFFESPSSFNLEELNLSFNLLGKEGAKLLSDFLSTSIRNSLKEGKPMKLKDFDCSYNDLGNDGIAFIAKCLEGLSSLESIDLASNGIGSSGMTALSNVFYSNPCLEKIILNINNLLEGGVNRLSSCLKDLGKLQILGLKHCRVGSSGVLHLALAMKDSCPELRKVDLSFNEIDSNVDMLLDAMENKKYFEDLDISCNDFNEETEISLLQRIFRMKRRVEMMASDDDMEVSDSDSD
ncbi:ran GTPase-activating protein 1-like [Argiope bruennichi]|nr:ran GTPase-activating protein 1-like [Argiope bruennichi]